MRCVLLVDEDWKLLSLLKRAFRFEGSGCGPPHAAHKNLDWAQAEGPDRAGLGCRRLGQQAPCLRRTRRLRAGCPATPNRRRDRAASIRRPRLPPLNALSHARIDRSSLAMFQH